MVSPLKATPRTSRVVQELAQIHFRQHLERANWRLQLEALKDTLQTAPRDSTEHSSNDQLIVQLQSKARALFEELEKEREQVRLVRVQLDTERLQHQNEVQNLSDTIEREKHKRVRLMERTKELLRRFPANQPQISNATVSS